MFDVVIIGAGVVGSLIARSLSQYNLKIALVDKAGDISEGASKANSGIIHAGYDAKPGTLKAKLNVRGNYLIKNLVNELSVNFSPTGSLVVAFNDEELKILEKLYQRGLKNNVPNMEIVWSKDKLNLLEPYLNEEVKAALYAPTAGIICPYGLAIAASENAVENGVELFLETAVQKIDRLNQFFFIQTNRGIVKTCYIVNASGVHADEISQMLEEKWFTIKPRLGEYLLLDKGRQKLATKTLFGAPTPLGKGVLVTPTVDGNVLLGPTSDDQKDKLMIDTTHNGMDIILSRAKRLIPSINPKDVINSFAGLRAVSDTGDFIVQASDQVPKFIHAAGIDSPGLTAAPAIAERIVEILANEGLNLVKKPDYTPIRKPILNFKELTDREKAKILKENPLYGNVICRCETVTEAEIVESIRRSAGARNLDGVKRRVRAGMGRCQSGFCTPRLAEILARELGIPMEMVTKKSGKSKVLVKKLKDV